ncbi:serine hydrolase domain-containing protein [Gemmatimonadota bacterium]
MFSASNCGPEQHTEPSGESANDYSELIEEYQEYIPEVMEKEKIPGLALAIVDKEGVIWSQGFGYTDTTRTTSVNDETIFSIQSASKSFTATTVMLAVQDGLLDLDTPLSTYLPGFKVKSCFEENPQDKITLRHLLSHKAGFEHEAPVGNNYNAASPSFEAHVKSIQETWLKYPVGERYSYSNLGIDIAAYIIQVVSGKPVEQYMRERLFDPLGMTTSSADLEEIEKNKNRALGHNKNWAQDPRPLIPMLGAGGVYSNAKEMAKYIQFHLNRGKIDGKTFLRQDLLDEMYTVPFPATKEQLAGYALGIDTKTKYYAYNYSHGGGGFGFLFNMIWYPEFGIGVTLLTNSTSHSQQNKFPEQLLDKIIKDRQGTVHEDFFGSKTPVDIDLEHKKKLVGQYLGRFKQVVALKGDKLGFQYGKNFQPFVFYSETEVSGAWDIPYRFVLDGDGNPSYLLNVYSGMIWDYDYGPSSKPGPDEKHWEDYTGEYTTFISNDTLGVLSIYRENGHLFYKFGNSKAILKEYDPGLFFTANGESFDFNNNLVQGIFKLKK